MEVVPPDRTMEPVRACTPSLFGGSRNDRPPPAPPPPRCGHSAISDSAPRPRPIALPPPEITGDSSEASNHGISWSSAM